MLKKLFYITCLVFAGCGGGLNCPLDPPSCCYNNLFGCGTFDLPFGCECSDYGLSVPEAEAAKNNRIMSSNNDWSGVFNKTSATCPFFRDQISGTLRIQESKNGAKVMVPGYGTLNGRGNVKTGSTLSGTYTVPTSGCKAKVSGLYKRRQSNSSKMSLKIDYVCGLSKCTASYQGNLVR